MIKTIMTRWRNDEKGFTLMELLIVIGIMAILLAVAVASLTGLIGSGSTESKKAELSAVQTAVDAWMAVNTSANITARGTAAVITAGDGDAPFKSYLRQLPTKYGYSWTTDGTVSQQ